MPDQTNRYRCGAVSVQNVLQRLKLSDPSMVRNIDPDGDDADVQQAIMAHSRSIAAGEGLGSTPSGIVEALLAFTEPTRVCITVADCGIGDVFRGHGRWFLVGQPSKLRKLGERENPVLYRKVSEETYERDYQKPPSKFLYIKMYAYGTIANHFMVRTPNDEIIDGNRSLSPDGDGQAFTFHRGGLSHFTRRADLGVTIAIGRSFCFGLNPPDAGA